MLRSLARMAFATLLVVCVPATTQAQFYQARPLRTPGSPAYANPQSPTAARTPASNTELSFEIFQANAGVNFHAQQWQSAFEHAQVPVQIRSSVPTDKIGIKENKLGKLRQVMVTGRLEKNGTLVFPGRSFSTADSAALEEWIAELRTYGAQGNPSGQPLWGLSKGQFDEVYQALSAPVVKEVAELPFDEAIRGLQLPAQLPFKVSTAAEPTFTAERLRRKPPRISLEGFSQGTALAMLLSQYGLGFRPNRKPDGTIELLCVVAQQGQDAWPIGWDRPEGTLWAKIVPSLYQQTQVELKDQKLMDVLEAIADKTKVPVRIDAVRIEARGLDLNSVLVNVPSRRLVWVSLLEKITNPSYLTAKVRCDETKKPFVWVTVLPKRSDRLKP